jgi:hypothetical protein
MYRGEHSVLSTYPRSSDLVTNSLAAGQRGTHGTRDSHVPIEHPGGVR